MTVPEVESGILSQPSVLRDMLSRCARWQTWTETTDVDPNIAAAQAAQRIFIGGFHDDVPDAIIRPRALVWAKEEDLDYGVLNGVASGIVRVLIEADTPSQYASLKKFDDADIWFRNHIGQVMAELRTLARAVAGGYLALRGSMKVTYLDRSDEDRIESEKDYCACEIAFPFGV